MSLSRVFIGGTCEHCVLFTLQLLCFSANTTRIFQGTRIVKTGVVSENWGAVTGVYLAAVKALATRCQYNVVELFRDKYTFHCIS